VGLVGVLNAHITLGTVPFLSLDHGTQQRPTSDGLGKEVGNFASRQLSISAEDHRLGD